MCHFKIVFRTIKENYSSCVYGPRLFIKFCRKAEVPVCSNGTSRDFQYLLKTRPEWLKE